MLSVENLDVFYGAVQAVWDVSFEVAEGEVVALIGANGAGKSTVLKAVAGLLAPRRGRILFGGLDIGGHPPYDMVDKGLVLIPEARQLWPGMTVRENLEMGAYGAKARPARRQTLDMVLAMFPQLAQRQRQKAGTLSGGEQQMCAMGRALMARPKLLMLDEPSLGLSPILVETIFSIIGEINSTGTPVLLVEQNARKALEVAHRGYVIETGVIVQTGSGKELLSSEEVQKAYLGM